MTIQVSVIIPTYNRAQLIQQTLNSICRQSYPAAEIIVVDDGSADATEAVLRKFGSAIRYLRTENAGPCHARNVGVSASTAAWVAFCDSDDLWLPNKLRCQVQLLEKAPDVEYSFTNFQIVNGEKWSKTTKFDTLPQDFRNLPQRKIDSDGFIIEKPLFERLLSNQPIFPSTIMMKRTFFEAVGFWEESLGRTVGEDFEFALRCGSRSPMGVVKIPVVGIRKHAGNFSKDALRMMLGDIEILRFVLKNHSHARDYADIIEKQIGSRSASAAEGAFRIGDFDTVRRLLEHVQFSQRSWKLHVKSLIAYSPNTLGNFLQKAILAIGRFMRT